ncbi:UDP-N-acetylmuramate dehydrogenase [Nostocales cyanobacterium LEGE 11386]|nr:UDP-N-acetylmuramate dehydrogenase [Nostocales cyanobacterium LEGE 11386]
MKLFSEHLSKHTTFKVGGPADVLLIPETLEELFKEIEYCRANNTSFRVLGNGSNILVSDDGVRGYVIKLNKCCNHITLTNQNQIRVGAGVSLQSFIKFSIKNNLYGNEFLSSVPGTIGGAIFMNAGTWVDKNLYVSDFLTHVKYFDGSEIKTLTKDECSFSYRSSIFHKHEDWIILEACFNLPFQPSEVGEEKRKQRLEWSILYQDIKYPNAGSIFCQGNGRVFNLLKGIKWKNVGWSEKTGNWINIYGTSSSRDIYFLIKVGKLLHYLFLKKVKTEIRIWN